MAAVVIPFRSQFDIDCESAVAAALFGPADTMPADGGRARIKARRARIGLGEIGQGATIATMPGKGETDSRPSELA